MKENVYQTNFLAERVEKLAVMYITLQKNDVTTFFLSFFFFFC